MTLEGRIDALVACLEDGTRHLSMKRPGDDDATLLEYAPPSVNAVYIPIGGALTNEQYYRAPSITVMPGECSEKAGEGNLPVVLILMAWDPGTRDVEGEGVSVTDLNGDGWRALTTMIDTVIGHLRSIAYAGGMTLDDELHYGVYDSNFTDLRPYYFGWVQCTFSYQYGDRAKVVNDLLN
ncbi:hypothetical protein ACH6CV_14470 [Bacillota bacterium Meth-B3]